MVPVALPAQATTLCSSCQLPLEHYTYKGILHVYIYIYYLYVCIYIYMRVYIYIYIYDAISKQSIQGLTLIASKLRSDLIGVVSTLPLSKVGEKTHNCCQNEVLDVPSVSWSCWILLRGTKKTTNISISPRCFLLDFYGCVWKWDIIPQMISLTGETDD